MSRLSSSQPTDYSPVHRWVALNAVVQTLSETPDLTAALPSVLDHILREVLAQEGGWLMLLDQTGSVLHLVAPHGVETDALAHWQAVDAKVQRGHLATQLEAPLLLDDLSPYPELALLAAQGWKCYLGIPLLAGNRPLGLLATLARGQCPFREEDHAFLRAVGQQMGMAIENARLKTAAEQSEHCCQKLIAHYPFALLLIDDELRIIHANPLAAELTGYTLDGLVGMDIRWIFPPEFHQELATLSNSNESSTVCREITLIAKDGQRLEAEIIFTNTCQEWAGKRVTCLCLRDLPSLKREESILRPLNAAALALQRAHTAEDVFTVLSEQLSQVGLKTAVAILDEGGHSLTLKHLSPAPEDQTSDQELIGTQIPLKAIPTFEQVVTRGQPRFALNLQPNDDFWPRVNRVFGQGPCICAPLLLKDRVHGLLTVTAPFLTEADVQAVSSFAQQIATALDNIRLYQAATQRAQELSTINDIGRAITSTLDLDSLLERTMEGVNQILNVEAGSILLVDEETGDLVFRVSLQNDEWQRISNLRVPAGTGVVGAVVKEGKPQIVPDVSRDPRFYSRVDSEMGFTTRSILCVPLIVRGQPIGAIEVLNKIGGQFSNEDLELLSSIAASVGVAIENATLYKAVQTHAEELEKRVAERTHDLNLAIEELFERERAQREISEQLRKANREIEAILNSVADGLIVTDGHGYMRMANPRAEELLGFRLEDLQGKHIAEDKQASRILRLLAHKIAQRSTEASTVELEIPSPKQNLKTHCWEDFQCSRQACPVWGQEDKQCWLVPGTICRETHLSQSEESPEITCLACERYQRLEKLTLQAHSAPILSEGQQVMGTVTVLRDITRLRELDRLKSKFVSNVSHELRTPLTNIKMYISLLKHGKAEKHARYLEIIERESDRLRMLIEDVLSLSRLEARETPPQRTQVAISEIVESVLNIHRPQAENKTIDLSAQIAPFLPLIKADRNQIIQMLTNLVSNALNYTLEGGRVSVSAFQVEVKGGKIRSALAGAEEDLTQISLNGVRDGTWIAIRVADTGIGIPEEDRERIFDRFYRGKVENLGIPGTGLGLPIVKEILELHDGHIFVESEEGVGSTFTVLLPVPAARPTDRPVVLVADDDPMVGNVVSRFLSTAEFQVELVHDGAEVIKRTASLKPDLIVLDLAMPVMDGYEVLRRLRDDPETRDLPVLVLSGWEEARSERAMTLGANEFLTKPFSGKVLADVVRRLLNLD